MRHLEELVFYGKNLQKLPACFSTSAVIYCSSIRAAGIQRPFPGIQAKYYAVDTEFPLVALFMNTRLGLVKRCDLTRVNVLFTKRENMLLLEYNEATWPAGEVVS